jgi:outer membrane protein OmpA-like peptidoglycan-associated protein
MAHGNKESEDHWISMSDMMSGLMMVFLFISVSYMLNVSKEKDAATRAKEQVQEIAVTYHKLQNELYADLLKEFREDLDDWNATIDKKMLSVRFEAPDVLFAQGSAEIRLQFKNILSDFFPRYIEILSSDRYKSDIEEIRIEGHTSSDWSFEVPPDESYFYNMELSQNRTRKVLEFVLRNSLEGSQKRDWVKERLTANGLSSSKLIFKDGQEDRERSRRVEFRVRTNAEDRMIKILAAGE